MAFAGSAFRVVLFGMPDAGKSSLLGALAEAAQKQEQVLGGKLTDKSQGLIELQRRLYDNRPRETLEEITPYAITVAPLPSKTSPAGPVLDAVLFDCDGRRVNELLANDELESDKALPRAVLEADTLVLVVDGSTEPAHVKRDFGLFADFLRALEQTRGQRAEVAGLPVFLVLTKCDLLAQPKESTLAWMDRIEERKREVHQRFEEFLSERAAQEQMSFGKIDLHVWATAVKRPATCDAPAKPREPYGVAELFRQCLAEAATFRGRRWVAAGRLAWVLASIAGLVGFMILLGLFFLAQREQSELERLERELRSYRSARGEGAERLHEPVGKTIAELREFRQNPLFDKMPVELQTYVDEHLHEAEAYEDFTKKFQVAVKQAGLRESPRFAKDEDELSAFGKQLKQMPIPPTYQAGWQNTEIARKQRQWADEIEVMQTETRAAIKSLNELFDLDAKIKDRRKYTGEQLDQFMEELKLRDRNMPYRADNNASVRKSRVTYANVAQFQPVALHLARYDKVRSYYKLGEAK
jgi:GTPase SAR1 family protein